MSDNFIVNDGTGAKVVPVEVPTERIKVEGVTPVEKKKRGRPAKKVEAPTKPVREFRCSTCREMILEHNVMKIGAGENRWALFCPFCQKALGFLQPDVDKIVDDLIKNNPTGK